MIYFFLDYSNTAYINDSAVFNDEPGFEGDEVLKNVYDLVVHYYGSLKAIKAREPKEGELRRFVDYERERKDQEGRDRYRLLAWADTLGKLVNQPEVNR